MLSIIIPVFNEGPEFYDSIDTLKKELPMKHEIIISDDGSKKECKKIIHTIARSYDNIKVITNIQNRGRGHAIKKAANKTKYPYTIFMDADIPLETDLRVIKHIYQDLSNYEIVKPSRFLPSSKVQRKIHRKILGDVYMKVFHAFFPYVKITDTQMGFKGFQTRTLRTLCEKANSERWSWDIEILLEATLQSYSIKEIPIIWTEKFPSTLKVFKDAPEILFSIIRFRREYPRKLGLKKIASYTKKMISD